MKEDKKKNLIQAFKFVCFSASAGVIQILSDTLMVEVIKLICDDSIEGRVIELQNVKKDLIDKLISNDDSKIINASLEDIRFILK